MPRPIRFWKLSGAGNDFVLLEGKRAPAEARRLAKALCDRREGVGADGILIATRGRVEYFNADGSHAFCGNGARSVAWWMHRHGWCSAKAAFTFSGVQAEALVSHRGATLHMPDVDKPGKKSVPGRLSVDTLDTGVPHAVVKVSGAALKDYPVVSAGRALRHHRAFKPHGANIDFVARAGRKLVLRTYERGVEDETMACGTGAVAAALTSGLPSPVTVDVRGGTLKVSFKRRKDGGFSDVWLEGPVALTFTGEVTL
jgi:diaminopimelate epimerase